MAGYEFKPSRNAGATIAEMRSGVYDAASTFLTGAVLILAADGELEAGGADPTGIVGVALEPANSRPGYGIGHNPTIVTWRKQEITYAVANRTTIFSGRGVNGGTDPVTPLQTHIGEAYGLTVDATGTWVIDFAETANTRLRIVDIDVPNRIFYFKFLESALGAP